MSLNQLGLTGPVLVLFLTEEISWKPFFIVQQNSTGVVWLIVNSTPCQTKRVEQEQLINVLNTTSY